MKVVLSWWPCIFQGFQAGSFLPLKGLSSGCRQAGQIDVPPLSGTGPDEFVCHALVNRRIVSGFPIGVTHLTPVYATKCLTRCCLLTRISFPRLFLDSFSKASFCKIRNVLILTTLSFQFMFLLGLTVVSDSGGSWAAGKKTPTSTLMNQALIIISITHHGAVHLKSLLLF